MITICFITTATIGSSHYMPGDVAEVDKRTARLLIKAGLAYALGMQAPDYEVHRVPN